VSIEMKSFLILDSDIPELHLVPVDPVPSMPTLVIINGGGSNLNKRMQGLSLGWSTGGPAALENLQNFRGVLTADRFLDVWNLRSLDAKSLSGDYLGPLNPVWDPDKTRLAVAEHWNGQERRRPPHFKQPLQDMEHFSAANLRDYAAGQIRQTLEDNEHRKTSPVGRWIISSAAMAGPARMN